MKESVLVRGSGLLTLSASLIMIATLVIMIPLFLPSSLSPAGPVGRVIFASSGQLDPQSTQGLGDLVILDLHGLGTLGPGRSFYAWLLPDPGNDHVKPLLLGKFNGGRIQFTSPDHRDLLTTFSGLRITEEDASPTPETPSLNSANFRYQGSLSQRPRDEHHYSLLDHTRHLLAQDPTLQNIGLSGGLEIWFFRNSQKLLEYASSARDEWSKNVDLLRRQVFRILQYLDGANYSWQDTPVGTPWLIDASAGRIGLLDIAANQQPPGYLSHVLLHLSGLLDAPGSNAAQKQIAQTIDATVKSLVPLYKAIRTDAIQLARMTDAQLLSPDALSLLNDMQTKANAGFAGQTDPVTGEFQPGISWTHGAFQKLSTFDVFPVQH
jgi:hypothetical protein